MPDVMIVEEKPAQTKCQWCCGGKILRLSDLVIQFKEAPNFGDYKCSIKGTRAVLAELFSCGEPTGYTMVGTVVSRAMTALDFVEVRDDVESVHVQSRNPKDTKRKPPSKPAPLLEDLEYERMRKIAYPEWYMSEEEQEQYLKDRKERKRKERKGMEELGLACVREWQNGWSCTETIFEDPHGARGIRMCCEGAKDMSASAKKADPHYTPSPAPRVRPDGYVPSGLSDTFTAEDRQAMIDEWKTRLDGCFTGRLPNSDKVFVIEDKSHIMAVLDGDCYVKFKECEVFRSPYYNPSQYTCKPERAFACKMGYVYKPEKTFADQPGYYRSTKRARQWF